ncbi:hypothetical protein GCM10025772_13340 [Ferrimonas gelatinilytica]|uniref:Uncharacterized protein n=1 Tax=Ferrimonas gelatinilytica TaxID=1255257 RepID=A0ABP9S2L0_9GAMM
MFSANSHERRIRRVLPTLIFREHTKIQAQGGSRRTGKAYALGGGVRTPQKRVLSALALDSTGPLEYEEAKKGVEANPAKEAQCA